MLTVLDEYTREALTVAVKPRMGNAEVLEALYSLFLKHGKPEFIRSDNGPEFIAEAFQAEYAGSIPATRSKNPQRNIYLNDMIRVCEIVRVFR